MIVPFFDSCLKNRSASQPAASHMAFLILQHTATHALQHTVTHCNSEFSSFAAGSKPHDVCDSATHCNTLQHTATHCNTLQHTAPQHNTLQHMHCNTLQRTATVILVYRCQATKTCQFRCATRHDFSSTFVVSLVYR